MLIALGAILAAAIVCAIAHNVRRCAPGDAGVKIGGRMLVAGCE